jgi:hypothetical protein
MNMEVVLYLYPLVYRVSVYVWSRNPEKGGLWMNELYFYEKVVST